MADKVFTSLPTATVTTATDIPTVLSGVWKKFPLGDIPVAGDLSGTLSAAQIAAGAVGTVEIADASVATAKIADGAVTTAKITDANITTAKIADTNVTTAKLATGAVTTAKITAGAVTTAELGDASVTTAKLVDLNVTSGKIANGSITNNKIATGAVGTLELADVGVTDAKLSTSGVTAATYGSSTQVGQFTVNNKGRITSAANVTIAAGGAVEYDAGNGAIVTATAAGVTFTRNGAAEGTFSIPSGVRINSFSIYNITNPGANFTLIFNYTGNTLTNQGGSTARPPILYGARLGGTSGSNPPSAPPYSVVHGSVLPTTAMQTVILAVGSGNISMQITNYSTALQANQTLLYGSF